MSLYVTCSHCSGVARQTHRLAWYDDADPCDACRIEGGVTARHEDGSEFVPDEDAFCAIGTCIECNQRRAASACGWAFDAGMREAERDRAEETVIDAEWSEAARIQAAAVAAERERCAKVEAELRAALSHREDEWSEMHDAVRRCFWEGLSRDGRLIPSEQLTKRLIEARDLLHKIDGAPAPMEG